jgi:hypothetical protein
MQRGKLFTFDQKKVVARTSNAMTFRSRKRILFVYSIGLKSRAARRPDMRPASIVFALLFGCALAANAQAGATNPLYVQPPPSQGCPVGLSATREVGGPLHAIDDPLVSGGRQVRINFAAGQAVLKADIIVHGMKSPSAQQGLILTGPAANSQNNTESFQLVGSAASPLLHSTIATKRMTAISWLELTRLEFSDGTIWQRSGGSRCVVAPSLYVPVDSAR